MSVTINTVNIKYEKTAPAGGAPSFLTSDGETELWYISDADNVTIVTGVSQWNDMSGHSRNLLQATGADQPTFNSSTGIAFDGTSDYLETAAFTAISPPLTLYLVFLMPAYQQWSTLFSYNGSPVVRIVETWESGRLEFSDGTYDLQLTSVPINTWGVITIIVNGASSSIQLNDHTPVTGTMSTAALNGFAAGTYSSDFAYVTFKEIIVRSVAETSDNKTSVIDYLMTTYSIA
jgi:hypothetical protein